MPEITENEKEEAKKQLQAEEEEQDQEDNEQTFTEGLGYDSDISKDESLDLMIKSARGILGIPYQFMSSVDPKLTGSKFGRKYAEKIIGNLPMLLLTPGRPKFMQGFKKADKRSLFKALVNNHQTTIDQIINNQTKGKFYSFEFNYSKYYEILNPMCHKVAILLGIGDEIMDGTSLADYDWSNYANNALKGFINSKESIAFYVDSESSINSTFSNDTSASMLANSVNGMSDAARELQFLMGTGGKEFDIMKSENYDASMEKLDSFANKFSGIMPTGLLDKLKEGVVTVSSGGKMYFPELWSDSQYSPSYDVNIKLRSPDKDKLSLYLNIMIPLLHLIALTAPQQLGANGYQSPFLIRGYYKGFFNINMGIITSLSITKGDKGKWTADGLPTQIDISMNLKELYNVLSLTKSTDIIDEINNTALLDYLANMCGINVNKVDIARSIDIYFNSIKNGMVDKITFNKFTDVQEKLTNILNNVFNRK